MKTILVRFLLTSLFLIIPFTAWAGDAVTVIFGSGQVVKINDGYRQIADGLKSLQMAKDGPQIIEISVNGNTMYINLAEVVLACRDTCSSAVVMHQLAPKDSNRK
jgi:hypothetical protein